MSYQDIVAGLTLHATSTKNRQNRESAIANHRLDRYEGHHPGWKTLLQHLMSEILTSTQDDRGPRMTACLTYDNR